MSPAVRNCLLAAVALAALGFAATRLLKSPAAEYPDDPAEASTWVCVKCGAQTKLTPRRFNELVHSKDKIWRSPEAPQNEPVFWCEACQAYTVCAADECPVHGPYPLTNPQGELLSCPRCAEAQPAGS